MSDLTIEGGRRRARIARRIVGLGIYVMRYGTTLATVWLLGVVLDVFGLVALNASAATQLLVAAGLVLVSRLLGVALLALAGMLMPRARPRLTTALVLMPSRAHTTDREDSAR